MKQLKKAGMAIVHSLKEFTKEEEGMGTVEVILIIAVLITFVLILKSTLGPKIKGWINNLDTGGLVDEG
ncbi:hypothetical protein lbkm_3262 [Lachnospiraceae bacterium KM106-2]|nr:hypothetical protein lbkm_3262 [Lachnospiraceae bacterium KM106-2]